MSHKTFNEMAELMKMTSHPENVIPSDYGKVKKIVSRLGLTSKKIDCCVNGCMLYYKDDKNLNECKFCEEARYKPSNSQKKL